MPSSSAQHDWLDQVDIERVELDVHCCRPAHGGVGPARGPHFLCLNLWRDAMSTAKPCEGDKDDVRQARERLNRLIGKQVIHTLGEPRDLQQVQVRRLWDDYFRVNVFVGGDMVSAKVAHSYFLAADGDGKVLTSSPTITKRY
jgi:hypothetical protein